jgi:NAD(P)-dependent dehydrogenase (short-subunit alcohol dehydrogenase family)
MTEQRFAGKVVVVTGGAAGIGEAIARRFAAEGGSVVIADLNGARAQETADKIKADGDVAIAVACDVGSSEQVDAMVSRAEQELGPVDVLVNNAGDVTVQKHFLTTDEAWWDHFIRTNLTSHYLCSRRVATSMVKRGSGSIINMSSGGATRAHRGMVAYDASKGGVEAFTRALALELAPYGVRVNALVPGLIATHPGHLEPAAKAHRDGTVPLGRGGSAEDLAGPAVFLASDDAAYVTGACLVVDGGVLVQQRSPQVETFPPGALPALSDL